MKAAAQDEDFVARSDPGPDPGPAASTFFMHDTETQFSVNIANDSSDVYLYFASPAYSWVGVGFGRQMENSLMVVMYPDASGESMHLKSLFQRLKERNDSNVLY